MNRLFDVRLATLAAVIVVAMTATGTATAAAGYEPFVTDFPKGTAPVEPYAPFATDFGIAPRPAGGGFTIHARSTQDVPVASGRAWGDVAMGGGLGIAFATLLAAAGLAVRSARRAGRRPGLEPQAAPPR